jgi:hypothetical protein
MPKIRVSTDELTITFRIWLAVLGQRQPSILRDLWSRKDEEYDREKIALARGRLARILAENLERSRWQVAREETTHGRTSRIAEEE